LGRVDVPDIGGAEFLLYVDRSGRIVQSVTDDLQALELEDGRWSARFGSAEHGRHDDLEAALAQLRELASDLGRSVIFVYPQNGPVQTRFATATSSAGAATEGSANQAVTVLLVDDEPDILELARMFLEMDGLTVNLAVDGIEALERYAELNPPPQPAVVVLDNRMPGLTGVQVAEQMLQRNPGQLIVLFTAFLDQDTQDAAAAVGVSACVSKKDLRQLPQIIRGLMPAA